MKKIIAGILMFAMLAALTVVGVSAAFTPSVENKEAEIDSATINGTNVTTEIAITPLKESANLDATTKENLDKAVEELQEKIPENVVSDIDTADYKVGAVVDVSYSGTESLDNAEIKVKVKVDFPADANVEAIYQNTATGNWEDANCVYENGVATLTMKHFCPVAFLVENKSVIVSDPSVNPPQTGDSMTPAVIALGALLVSGAVAAAVVSKKRENA